MHKIVPEDFYVPDGANAEEISKEAGIKEISLLGSSNWALWMDKESKFSEIWEGRKYKTGARDICRNYLSRGRLISDSNEIVSVSSSRDEKGIIVKISQGPHEGIVSLRCTNIVARDIPNFPKCHGVFRAGAPLLTFRDAYYNADENPPPDEPPHFYILTEYIRGATELGEEVELFPMALAQAIFAAMHANSKFNYVHNDMHSMNVLVMKYDEEKNVPVYIDGKKKIVKTDICSFIIDSQFSSFKDPDLGVLSFNADGVSFNMDGAWIVDIVRLILHGYIILEECHNATPGDSRLKILEELWSFFSDEPIDHFREFEDIFFSMPMASDISRTLSKKDFYDKVIKVCGLTFVDRWMKKNELKKVNGSCFDGERGFREYELPSVEDIKKEIYFLPRKKTYNLPCCRRLICLYMEIFYRGGSEKRLSKIFEALSSRYKTIGPWGMDEYLSEGYHIIKRREELKR